MPLPCPSRSALLPALLPALLLPVLLLPACAATTPVAPGPAVPLNPADALGMAIAQSAGDPYSMQGLRFTFVVREQDQDKVRRVHTWCPQTGQVQVQVGSETHSFDWHHSQELDRALGWFINDSYWLLAATKVMEPGVQRQLDDGALLLSFDAVGLTPGDRYWLRPGPDGSVSSWRFELQGGGAGEYQWLDYEQVGPLHLSTRRVNGSGREILFQDLAALESCPL